MDVRLVKYTTLNSVRGRPLLGVKLCKIFATVALDRNTLLQSVDAEHVQIRVSLVDTDICDKFVPRAAYEYMLEKEQFTMKQNTCSLFKIDSNRLKSV